jgi:hypothetical protein
MTSLSSSGTLAPALRPMFDDVAGRAMWTEVEARLRDRPFLRSEGLQAMLVMPSWAAPWLVERSRLLVGAFHRFYRAIVDAQGPLADEPARRIEQPYERIAEVEGARDPILLGRYDCVLDAQGGLRVIELNPIGICTLHLRSVSYLTRELVRMGGAARATAARVLDDLRQRKVSAIRGFCEATLAARPARPTVGILTLPGMLRGTRLVWRHELAEAGFDAVLGRPTDVRVEGGRVRLDGKPIDVLWVDGFLYVGYQQRRYEQTRFASRVGDYSKSGAIAEALLTLPSFAEAVRDRAVTIISPMRAYRALSKALLAWIERPALAISDEDRRTLREHVTRTHDHAERMAQVITPERARKEREAWVLKPCRFGGSHGVQLGRDTDPDAWARRLDEIWSDPEWVLQAFSEPVLDEHGATLSFGLYDYGGELGGILVRSARQSVVSARTADVIVAAIA